MRLLNCIITIVFAATVAASFAQPYPSKPVRIIIAFPPGGGTDIVGRIISSKLSEALGQQVVIDNRGGASGLLGTELAARAAPDGYTIFMGTMGNFVLNPVLFPKAPFDIARDFALLTQAVAVVHMLYVHPSFPVKSVKDLIALAKSRPGQVNYASSGNGGFPHLAAELFNSLAGVKMVHVPYKGSGPLFIDLLGGHVPLVFDSLTQGLQYVKTGRLRAIATLGAARTPVLPDVPAVAETLRAYDVINWYGLAVPKATPLEVVNRLHSDLVKVLRSPDIRDRLAAQGVDPVGSSPEEFGTFMKAESVKWARVIKEANIRAD